MPKLEIACFKTASALVAQAAGADRIELCDGFAVGGITPSLETLESVKSQAHIPVFVMVRPRGGDFVYSNAEFEHMKASITAYRSLADGFVFGVLDHQSHVDKERNMLLIELAKPKPCTFHRAFDSLKDIYRGLEDVIRCGFSTVLTSGGAVNALSGVETIAALINQSDDRICIMPGGAVRSSNIEELRLTAPAQLFHSSAVTGENEQADPIEVALLKAKL
ncbi:MAG: hypothetical protein MMC23_003117 [Stictis urceolatum]|nr:hypothetical protein [Stictis urceolata]